MVDDWHANLARELALYAPRDRHADDAAALEIEFGKARSAITYALELARAHRVPIAGNVAGDEVWLKLGDGRARFLLNRREAYVAVAAPSRDELRAQWNAQLRSLVDPGGNPVDLGATARAAVDGLVAQWRKLPMRTPVPPVGSDHEDEPTKG